jgi:RpiB/LacA/LacB family sugar-phosphate isomerase
MKVACAFDHAGFPLKEIVLEVVRQEGHEPIDLGTNSTDPVDYPDTARAAADAVRDGHAERAVVVCGSGAGVAVAACKVPGIRAACAHDVYTGHQCVEHDDVNVLCLGARVIGPAPAREVIVAFLGARFTGEERHVRRLGKIQAIEDEFTGVPNGTSHNTEWPVGRAPRGGSLMADSGDLAQTYLPIAEHGLVGDLHTVALVGTTGTIDWYCCPAFDAPSVFGSILDADDGGFYAIRPADDGWTSRQLYFPDTNILITRFFTESGVGEVQDFMPIESVDPGAHRHRLIRRVVVVRGEMRFMIEMQPRFDYGRAEHEVEMHPHGVLFRSPVLTLALEGAIAHAMGSQRRLERRDGGVHATFDLAAGQSQTFVLERVPADHIARPYPEHETAKVFEATVGYWRRWLAQSGYRGRWREMVQRSALTLKLLTYAPTGALVAAPTTSLPEQIGGERNWDYRYTWIRDAAFSLYGLLRLGFTEEAGAFMHWLTDRTREWKVGPSGPLQIMYGIDGRAELPEIEHPSWSGYRDSAPVRIGNAAADQRQLDIYGEMIDSIYLYNKYGRPIHFETWENVRRIVDWLCENWDQADEGIWETRGGQKDFTYSRLMSWVAIERAIRMNRARGLPGDIVGWLGERDRIYNQIMKKGWSAERDAFVQHYGSDVLDASILLMPLVLFIAPTDPRWLSTLDAVGHELVSDSLVYRYNVEASPDGLRGDEGTFSMCSFWYVEALTRAGRLDDARLAFEKMLTYANHLGLFSEEIGPTGEQLGNFPQAFTHLALISAAYNLNRALG